MKYIFCQHHKQNKYFFCSGICAMVGEEVNKTCIIHVKFY
ncbi:uncharacterized protein METZ01_LOCUS35182 [marine metagenome]|uniref:Uncharacterized protein n=1 Tax=marine metagenome TaxID=408172 RepID=A0A381QUK6_9ZZZZ